jgi:hypothetical protein
MSGNWNQFDTALEVVEAIAEYKSWISSEEELSERFDEEVMPEVLRTHGKDDWPAIMEAFNAWVDGLCRDGHLHPLQVSEYCYIGEHSDD